MPKFLCIHSVFMLPSSLFWLPSMLHVTFARKVLTLPAALGLCIVFARDHPVIIELYHGPNHLVLTGSVLGILLPPPLAGDSLLLFCGTSTWHEMHLNPMIAVRE